MAGMAAQPAGLAPPAPGRQALTAGRAAPQSPGARTGSPDVRTDALIRPRRGPGGRVLVLIERATRIIVLVATYLAAWPAAVPRSLGDYLFAINDNEACWRDWQITRMRGGLARRYRDPQFASLPQCPKCRERACAGEPALPGAGNVSPFG